MFHHNSKRSVSTKKHDRKTVCPQCGTTILRSVLVLLQPHGKGFSISYAYINEVTINRT